MINVHPANLANQLKASFTPDCKTPLNTARLIPCTFMELVSKQRELRVLTRDVTTCYHIDKDNHYQIVKLHRVLDYGKGIDDQLRIYYYIDESQPLHKGYSAAVHQAYTSGYFFNLSKGLPDYSEMLDWADEVVYQHCRSLGNLPDRIFVDAELLYAMHVLGIGDTISRNVTSDYSMRIIHRGVAFMKATEE